MACKNIQHLLSLSELVFFICKYKLKMEQYMQIFFGQNTGLANCVCKNKITFVFVIAQPESSSE